MIRLWRAFFNSRDGLWAAARRESAVRLELALLLLAPPAAWLATPSWAMRAVLIASLFLLLAVELLNTGIEKICDHVTPSQHPEIKFVKDVGSAAVLATSVAVALLWLAAILAG
jgi:diacylglycerol kinase (ATP)